MQSSPKPFVVESPAAVPDGGAERRRATLLSLLLAAAAGLTIALAMGADGSAAATRAGGATIRLLAPRSGTVIVVPTARGARRLRLAATVSISRPVRGLALRLNGHLIRLPARSGRVRIDLDAANGLVVGENLLWVSVGRRDEDPTARFVVGYRDRRALGVALLLGAGARPAAIAGVRVPSRGVDRLIVTLNGVQVRVPMGAYVLDLAQLGSLHWGSNRLRVRLIMLDGRIDDFSRTVQLDRRRDVAVARLHGSALVGRTIVLDARRSLIVPGVGQARGFRWLLLRRPAHSHVRLSSFRGVRTTLRPDVPGNYLVVLEAGRGSRRGYDLMTVSAGYSEPLVPIDTITYDGGTPGVRVENDFYPDPGAAPIQLVELKRSNLGLDGNLGFQASAQSFDTLGQALDQLPDSDFAIITHPGQTDALPPDTLANLDTALRKIGGTLPARWTLSQPDCWSGATDNCVWHTSNGNVTATWQRDSTDGDSFTVIGVHGLQAGQAWRESATQTGAQDGAISGYLTRGTDKDSVTNYTVINGGSTQYEAVETCAPPSCDVQVGYPDDPNVRTYPASAANGFQIVEVDRTTLDPILNLTVTTAQELLDALSSNGGQQHVGHFVGAMDDQRLIIIRSVGDGILSGPASTSLLQYIDQLGGTPELLVDAITGKFKYALVGAATNLPWRNPSALESSTEIPGTPPADPSSPGGVTEESGDISGVLARDRYGLYAPLAGDPVSTSNSELYQILYQQPTPWPWAGDPALPYIANALGLYSNPDVRSAYGNTNLPWTSLQTELSNLTCTAPTLCGPNFEAVKAELEKEFTWVPTVYNLVHNVLEPYEEGGDNAFDVEKVYDDVKASVPVPDTDTVSMGWWDIVTGVMKLAAGALKDVGAPELAAAAGIAGAVGGLATRVMQPNGNAAPADTLTSTATGLATQLNDQVLTYETWVNNQMEPILLGDYGKLKAVGTNARGNSAWDWESQTTAAVVTALRGNTRASAYAALLPKVWPGYNLKPATVGVPQPANDVKMLACDWPDDAQGQHQYPFAGATAQNQFWFSPQAGTQFQAVTSFQDGARVDQAWTFAQLDPDNWVPYSGSGARTATLPTMDLTHYIYGKDSADPNNGAYQFAPVWWRDTYNPPSHTLCVRTPGDSNYWSTQYSPPNVTPQP